MAKVKLSTKYALSDEAMGLISKGKTWWMRNRTTGTFVKMPYLAACQTFDFEIDLEDGEYQVSCGDYNAIDSNGRHCTQNIYFYVQDGKLHYVKRKDEFPSVTGGAPASDGGATQATFNPFASAPKTGTTPTSGNGSVTTETSGPEPVVNQSVYEEITDVLFCKKNCKVVTPDYTCVVDYTSDNTAVSGLDCCESCLFRQALFVKKE